MITVSNICLNPEFCNNKKRGPCSISLTDWTSQLRNLTTQGNVITGTWWTATGTQRYNNWPLSNPQIVQSYDLSNCQKGPSQTGSLSMVAFHIFSWRCELYGKGKTFDCTIVHCTIVYCANRNMFNRYFLSHVQVYNSIVRYGEVRDCVLQNNCGWNI